MNAEVQLAIDEIRDQFPDLTIIVAPDRSGGACVILENVPVGEAFAQASSWIGFHITHACPYADTYPHFGRADLARRDGQALPEGITPGHSWPQPDVGADTSVMPARPAVQISRRSNRRDAAGETPNLKLLKVLQWLKSR